jgi:2-keto-4-pentenoate hydratase/2-oxohepta-3-ene-1,7-dioic acid hydratase in catechol pathway
VPYVFREPSLVAVIGNGDAVVIPYGRDRIDWEVELGAVIGRCGKYITANARLPPVSTYRKQQ